MWAEPAELLFMLKLSREGVPCKMHGNPGFCQIMIQISLPPDEFTMRFIVFCSFC